MPDKPPVSVGVSEKVLDRVVSIGAESAQGLAAVAATQRAVAKAIDELEQDQIEGRRELIERARDIERAVRHAEGSVVAVAEHVRGLDLRLVEALEQLDRRLVRLEASVDRGVLSYLLSALREADLRAELRWAVRAGLLLALLVGVSLLLGREVASDLLMALAGWLSPGAT